ncbi:Metallo-dependent phosphatase-like protein [Tylopilus felleus]
MMDTSSYDELSFLHFNDVYHITQTTTVWRLFHVFRNARNVAEAERPITGMLLIPVLNHLLVDVACYGNHDFDFGEGILINLSKGCTFPWLLANAVHADGWLMVTAQEYKKGYRIGFLGLAGTDWPSNCQHLPVDSTILDPVSVAQRISKSLRSTLGIVIAITHMLDIRAVNDTFEGNIKLIESGTDFRSFREIKIINQTRNITLYSGMHYIVGEIQTHIADMVDKPLFHSAVPLDGPTSVVWTEETNMLPDAVRAFYNTDVAFINWGSLRCDRVIDAGVLTVKDMIVLPFDNVFVVKCLRGRTIAEALENAACGIIDNRFLLAPVGSRVHAVHFAPAPTVPRVPWNGETEYTVSMIAFIAEGFDGYIHMPALVDKEGAMTDSSLLLQVFRRDAFDVYARKSGVSIDRARAAIILGSTASGLPFVNPRYRVA